MYVKICGTTSVADAQLAVDAGADALGFIFAPSKRQVTVEQAAAITPGLPGHILTVGVFDRPDVEEIVGTVSGAQLTAVQMHWRHDPEIVGVLAGRARGSFELWQVVGYQAEPADPGAAERQFREEFSGALLDPGVGYVLLDTVKDGASGGLGQAFSWERAAQVVKPLLAEAALRLKEQGRKLPHLLIAGGLKAENVGEAIRTLQPWGVDVASGVEAAPGKKDPERLRAFVAAAYAAGRQIG